jgi:hypothetical protein
MHPLFRHPSESWGSLNQFNSGTGLVGASFRWHDGKDAQGEGIEKRVAASEWLSPCFQTIYQIT